MNSGGAEVALLKIAEALRTFGCSVEVFTTRSMRPYEDWLSNPEPPKNEVYKGFPIHRYPVDEVGFERFSEVSRIVASGGPIRFHQKDDFFRYGMTSAALVEALLAVDEDTLIVGGPYYQALIHNVVAALPGRVTVMPAFHDETPFRFEAVNRLIKQAKDLLFLTETEKTMTIEWHGNAMTRRKLETPVLSLPYIEAPSGAEQSQTGLAARLMGKYFLYIGRIDEGKNITQLMEWHHFANEDRLQKGSAAIPLLMAGKGIVPNFDSPHVKLLGFVSEEEKGQLIDDALGLINLSLNESFSFVLFEAWQRGVPVIVHKSCDVLRRHVDLSRGGYYCENAAEYCAALSQFEIPELRKRLSDNGRSYADQICSEDRFMRRLSKILEVQPCN